jgi:hypothetical protein
MFSAGACYELRLWYKATDGATWPLTLGGSDEDIYTSHPSWCPNLGVSFAWRALLSDEVVAPMEPPLAVLPVPGGPRPRHVSLRLTRQGHDVPGSDPESLRRKEVAGTEWIPIP